MHGISWSWIIHIGLAIFMFFMMAKVGGWCGDHGEGPMEDTIPMAAMGMGKLQTLK